MKKLAYILLLYLIPQGIEGQLSLNLVSELPSNVKETSGLIFLDNSLITHNDSGNAAELYVLNPVDGTIQRTVVVNGVNNVDWEDIAQDEQYIYIGDFGNNNGNRIDLKIWRIAKSDFNNSDTVDAEVIAFSYEDQTDFTTDPNTDWDAEALISYNGELIIFTKQWTSMGTVAYSISNQPGTHIASKLDDYQIDGLVTGATYDIQSNKVVLVGYSQFLAPFVVQIENPQIDSIFSGTVTNFSTDLSLSQIESVAFGPDTYYVSSEEFIRTSPAIQLPTALYTFELPNSPEPEPEPEPGPEPEPEPEPEQNGSQLILYQPEGMLFLNYVLNVDDDLFGYAIFDASGRRILSPITDSDKIGTIDTSILKPSTYFISFHLRGGRIAKPFVIR